jgi:hypothetical protein
MKRAMAVLLCGLVGGCATAGTTVYLRTDGRRVADHPELRKEIEIDRTICEGEAAKADVSDAPLVRRQWGYDAMFNGCMAQRGWVRKAG